MNAHRRTAGTPNSRRRIALPLVGAVAVGALAVAGGATANASGPAAPVAAPAAATALRAGADAGAEAKNAAAPRVVQPGERIEVGGGFVVWLTAQDEHVVVDPEMPDLEQAKKIIDDNVPEDTIGLRSFARPDGTLFTGAYRGDGDLHRVTITSQGVTAEAQVITLPGNPGWAAYHLHNDELPPPGTDPDDRVTITAYAADGTVLATLP
ncbi:hypothetical protein [Allostreptomyces psammosilenae]|uniref:Uncharacterized protein n=1 Tax=Allostreptomyces psammosilenae TaxID=1892865 RepID=A0A852ZQ48_9ACTN|nr:hypothetical protein [Allostreptomyces psammosilenae]NYI04523.1 hypothetical protein [Allostreptomyces psammosilenae]